MTYGGNFQAEAMQLLVELEATLLELEESPTDLKLAGRVFQAVHTIKLLGAIFDFEEDADLNHHMKLAFDKVQNGVLPMPKELIDLSLAAANHIKKLLYAALSEQELDNKRVKERAVEDIMAPAHNVDRLINLVGELVVTLVRLSSQVVNISLGANDLFEPVEGVERLPAELQDYALNIRTLPIETTFACFHRLARDLSAELGKEMRLETKGAET